MSTNNNEAFMSDEKEVGDLKVKVSVIEAKMIAIEEKVKSLVTHDQFSPVKLVVFGFVYLALSAVVIAILAKVIVK
jgi:hypothetical protein